MGEYNFAITLYYKLHIFKILKLQNKNEFFLTRVNFDLISVADRMVGLFVCSTFFLVVCQLDGFPRLRLDCW